MSKSGSQKSESPSQLIDARIKELGDWRGEMLSRLRSLVKEADPEVKLIARQQGEQAIARGVFGSPWIFVDGEPFWGSDRLPMVERWLEGAW